MQQVVWNLLSNAIKFTPRDGRVSVTLEKQNAHVELVVSDTGSGIAPEFLPHVFDRFRQADAGTTRQHGGLGLGLAIVRHLVELHGGSVMVESPGPGAGTTFRVLIPRTLPQREGETRTRERAPALEATPTRDSHRLDELRVLVVDDEPQARELFSAIVEHAGAEVRVAGSARDALAIVPSWPPDVVLSDIEMPLEDGYVLMDGLNALDGIAQRPIAVAVTAHSRPEDRLRALEMGFSWHLPKPVEPSELVSVIASLTGRVPKTT